MTPTIEPIKVFADIIKTEMLLGDGQIMLGLENWEIPKNEGLYIALLYGQERVVGQNNEFDTTDNVEVQSIAMLHEIVIEAMSFNSEARKRKEEVIMALNSVYAQNALDRNFMAINMLPQSFVAAPTLEETKQLNRYRTSFSMNALHQKIKAVDYYDEFTIPPAVTLNQ